MMLVFIVTLKKKLKVIVSGKLKAQRAKSMKFKDGYMVSSGQPMKEYIDFAVRHMLLTQVTQDALAMEKRYLFYAKDVGQGIMSFSKSGMCIFLWCHLL